MYRASPFSTEDAMHPTHLLKVFGIVLPGRCPQLCFGQTLPLYAAFRTGAATTAAPPAFSPAPSAKQNPEVEIPKRTIRESGDGFPLTEIDQIDHQLLGGVSSKFQKLHILFFTQLSH